MISHIDWCVGKLLDGLDELGLTDDTLIIFISDHGEHAGDHRLLYKGSLLFDGLMRVPFIISQGSRLRRGRRIRAIVQNVDVYPTVMSVVGLPIHAGVQGKDLSEMLTGGEEAGYDRVFCELDELPDKTYAPTWAVRDERWKLITYPVARTGMLFDLDDDPGEIRNLYFSSDHAEVRKGLMKDLVEHLYTTKDPLPIRLSQA